MTQTYELRTKRGAPVYRYDSLTRAREELAQAEKRIGVRLDIYRIVCTEELVQ